MPTFDDMHKMKTYFCACLLFVIVKIHDSDAELCGCKIVRSCYRDMIRVLQDRDEVACIEDASIGVSTVMIFLKSISHFCSEIMTLYEDALSYEGRHLYEVVLNIPLKDEKLEADKPILLIDAGQQAGTDTVGLALFAIEQLLGCEENADMISRVKWVILPSTNPDGMEYGRYNRVLWKKNVKPAEDGLSYGVDISRNFDYQWGSCERVESGFSLEFPGVCAGSENETSFIKKVILHHKNHLKLYLSIRRDGHAILYPFSYSKMSVQNNEILVKTAGEMAYKVNQRAGGVKMFLNQSIFEENGKPVCGHSVDFAYDAGVPLAYELRAFIEHDKRIMARFQQLPRGYEASLRLGYFSGIRELYNSVTADKKIKTLF